MTTSSIRKTLAAAAAGCALAAPFAAQASAVAYGGLSNLSFSVIDLDPNDGIAPSFEFVYQGQPATSVLPIKGGVSAYGPAGASQYSPITAAALPANVNANAQVDSLAAYGNGSISGSNLSGSAWASGERQADVHIEAGDLPWQFDTPRQIRVGAGTQLVVRASALLMASSWNGDIAAQCASAEGCPGPDYAWASAALALTDAMYTDSGSRYDISRQTVDVRRYGGAAPFTQALSADLEVAFANASGVAQDLSFRAVLEVHAYSRSDWPAPLAASLAYEAAVASVPEPQALASMLLGLVAVAGALRQRARRS